MPVATEVRERPILFSGEMVRALLAGTKTQTRRVAVAAENYGLSYAVQDSPAVWGDEEGEFTMRCPYGKPGDRLWVREAWQADFDYPGATGFPWWHEIPPAFRGLRAARLLYYRADGAVVHPPSEDEIEWGSPLPYEARLSVPDFDSEQEAAEDAEILRNIRWRPSIHMPRWASRISLEITDVRVERVQDISEADAQAEGAPTSVRVEIQHPLKVSRTLGFATMNCTHREAYHDLWDRLNAARGFGWDANPFVWVITFKRAEG